MCSLVDITRLTVQNMTKCERHMHTDDSRGTRVHLHPSHENEEENTQIGNM